ncbi:EAL domain-containing protein [Saccharospirillum mangrovi]|uniref:EAL domain-containing protein n=1 Tax=Saccharospirillum mangrovi TaxID=2161747 RepID=UPI000D3375DE|nr:EAL domain-containing protein [Saccharospirillum mangrovi]
MKYWFIPIWMILVIASVRAAEPLLVLQPDTEQVNLADYSHTWIDPAADTDWQHAYQRFLSGGFQSPDGQPANIGYTSSSLWVAVPIAARHQDSQPLSFDSVVSFDYPTIDWIDAWLLKDGRVIEQFQEGDRQPHPSQNEATFRPHLAMNFDYNDGSYILLSKLRSQGSVQAPMTLWEASRFYRELPAQNFIWGTFYGAIIFVLVFNLFLWVSTRRAIYPPYLLFVFSMSICVALLNGHSRLLLGQTISVHLVNWAPEFGILGFIGLILFTQGVLRTRQLGLMNRLLNISLLVNVVPVLVSPWISYRWISMFVLADLIWLLGLSLTTGALSLRRQRRVAVFYLTSWLPFLIAAMLFMTRNVGWLPVSPITQYALPAGLVMAVALLSLVIADSLKQAETSARDALDRERRALRALARNQEETTRQALRDPITGLPNKAQIAQFIDHIKSDAPLRLVIFRPDNLRELLNTLGESNVDQLTRSAAQRIESLPLHQYGAQVLNPGEPHPRRIAQVEGRNFLMILDNGPDGHPLAELAKAADAALNDAIALPGLDIAVQCRLGSSRLPEDGRTLGTLIRKAQVAVDQAINQNRLFMEYRADTDPYQPERLRLAYRLKQAIARNELELHYQPQRRLTDNHVYGVEALVRWPQADGAWIPPGEFIPIAERTGLMPALTDWVIQAACRASAQLSAAGWPMCVSINLCAGDLTRPNLPARLINTLAEHRLAPGSLAVEITESMLIDDWAPTVSNLEQLRQAGVRVSLDDFGTGYSSLSYLHALPIDCLKVDQQFVQQLQSSASAEVLVRSIVQLGKALGLDLVAEGVENEVTVQHLQRLGCGAIQGYWLAKPMPLEALQNWLTELADPSILPAAGQDSR